jgi:D-3-phosphoglycerate dehydrogenase
MPLPHEATVGLLGDLVEHVDLRTLTDRADRTELYAALTEAELVLASWQGTSPLPLDAAAVLASGPGLVFVQQPSVGVDSVDVRGFAARGVPVANTAGANAVAVAEWCVGAALAATRQLVWADGEVRSGRWPQVEIAARGSVELSALRVGVIGFGPIGATSARLFRAFGCAVSYWSRNRRPADESAGATWRDLDDLVASSDVLVVVLPLAEETRGLLDARRLALAPAGAYLINAARGGIVDEAALLAEVEAGRFAGAALDVFGVEPLPADDPLRRCDRIVLSPHCAGSSRQAQLRLLGQAVANLRRVVEGEAVRDVVNGVSPQVVRRG